MSATPRIKVKLAADPGFAPALRHFVARVNESGMQLDGADVQLMAWLLEVAREISAASAARTHEQIGASMFPENDTEFEESTITKVDGDSEHGWSVTKDDGWGLFVPKDAPFAPEVGMTIRLYGKGIGSAVRGMYLNGAKVFYRTEAEDNQYREIELYGANAADWLKRWDSGSSVWTIEMGGIGPGYEQCIHITCAEILRVMLDRNFDHARWSERDAWKADREDIHKTVIALPLIDKLGLSGARWGLAMNIASHLYMHGPRSVMKDERVKDRKIRVSRTFPG